MDSNNNRDRVVDQEKWLPLLHPQIGLLLITRHAPAAKAVEQETSVCW